jgi:DNA invertase Pin-like site-specific DNA recombinase
MRRYCAAQGWPIVREYIDQASGSRGDREQFLAMMQGASTRQFDLVMFWSLDRLSREGVLKTLTYLQQLDTWKVNYKSFTEQYLDSCGMFKDAVISILATVAKQERFRISERTKAGLERARRAGKRIGGIPKFSRAELRVMLLRQPRPSVRELAKRFNVTKQAVQQAIRTMEAKDARLAAADTQLESSVGRDCGPYPA